MSFTCEKCGRECASEAGLSAHWRSCEKSDDTVTLDRSQFEKMMERISVLEGKSSDETVLGADIDAPQRTDCRIKVIEGRPISRVHSVRQVGFDEQKNPIMKCTAVIKEKDGSEREIETNYTAYVNQNGEPGVIIDRKEVKMVKKGETVNETIFDQVRQINVPTGRQVKLADNYRIITHIVEWNGETVELDETN